MEGANEARRHRDSGYPLETWQIGAWEYEALLMIDEYTEYEEIEIQRSIKKYLALGFGIKKE